MYNNGAFPYLICVCESQTQITKIRLTRSRLPPKVKKLVANRKYLWFSVYVESLILGITNICDLLRVVANVTYGHLLVRNPYVSIRPERQERAFPLAFLSYFGLVQSTNSLIHRRTVSGEFFVSRCTKKTSSISDRRKSHITKFVFVIHKHKWDMGMLQYPTGPCADSPAILPFQ